MLDEHDLFEACVRGTKGGSAAVSVQDFDRSWRAMLHWLRSQVAKGNGGSVKGLCKIVWCTTPIGGPASPCFVLSERFLHMQLQLGPGITRSAAVQQLLGNCEEVNFAKLALSYGHGLARDVAATCVKATLHHLADAVQQGQAVQLDLGVGTLTIRNGRADFSFRAGLQQAATQVAATAAAGMGYGSGGSPLTADAVRHLTEAMGGSGLSSPTRSTISRVSGPSLAGSYAAGSAVNQQSIAGLSLQGGRQSGAGSAAGIPTGAASECADSLTIGIGRLQKGESHAAAVARVSQAAVLAAREGRQAAIANSRGRPAHFVLPVGGPGDQEEFHALPQGKARAGAAAVRSNPITFEGEEPEQPRQQRNSGQPAGRAGASVMEAAAARESARQQQLLAQQEKVVMGLAARKALLDEEAAALVAAQKEKQKQLAADLAQQIKGRQAAAAAAKGATPVAEQEFPLLGYALDSKGAVAKRHQEQAVYRLELEGQIAAKEDVRIKTAAAERELDQRRLQAVQQDLVKSVQLSQENNKQKRELFKQQLDQQMAARGAYAPLVD